MPTPYISTNDMARKIGISPTQFLLKIAVLGIEPDACQGKQRLWLPYRAPSLAAQIAGKNAPSLS